MIRAGNDFVLFTIDNEFEDIIELKNGLTLFKDVSYNPEMSKRIFGRVIAVCDKLTGSVLIKQKEIGEPMPDRYMDSETVQSFLGHEGMEYSCGTWTAEWLRNNIFEVELKPGDKIYFPYNSTVRDNQIKATGVEYEGQKVYKIAYHNIFCKVVEEKIVPLSGHVLVRPIVDTLPIVLDNEKGRLVGDLVVEMGEKPRYIEGILAYLCTPVAGEGHDVVPGERIIFEPERDWLVQIEGEQFYIMKVWNLLAAA